MALGHRPLVDGVGLGGLPLRLLECKDPVRGRAGHRRVTGRGDRGRRRGGGRRGLVFQLVLTWCWRSGNRRSGGGLEHGLHWTRRVRSRERRGAARRGIELSVVAAVDRDGELRGGGSRFLPGRATVGEELRGRHRHPRGHEPRQRDLERLDAVLPLPVEVHGEVGPSVEDASQQSRENGAGADLEERASAGGVHRFDHLDEADKRYYW